MVFLVSVFVAVVVLASARGLGAAAGVFVVVAGFGAAAADRAVAEEVGAVPPIDHDDGCGRRVLGLVEGETG